jgi:hypothetical protein
MPETTIARCPKSDLPVDGCACCKPQRPGRPRLVAINSPRWVHARFRGVCVDCGLPYSIGTLIQKDETTGRWRAECCPEGGDA